MRGCGSTALRQLSDVASRGPGCVERRHAGRPRPPSPAWTRSRRRRSRPATTRRSTVRWAAGSSTSTMRSGANQFHGGALRLFFVNEALNAGNPFVTGSPQGNPRGRARRNDCGFTLRRSRLDIPKVYDGHDKTFFFFNWEQFRETTKIQQPISNRSHRCVSNRRLQLRPSLPNAKVIGTDALGRKGCSKASIHRSATFSASRFQGWSGRGQESNSQATRFPSPSSRIR